MESSALPWRSCECSRARSLESIAVSASNGKSMSKPPPPIFLLHGCRCIRCQKVRGENGGNCYSELGASMTSGAEVKDGDGAGAIRMMKPGAGSGWDGAVRAESGESVGGRLESRTLVLEVAETELWSEAWGLEALCPGFIVLNAIPTHAKRAGNKRHPACMQKPTWLMGGGEKKGALSL